MSVPKVISIFLSLTVFCSFSLFSQSHIDVLVLYSPSVEALYNGSPALRINHLIETTNEIYLSSGLDAELRVVDMESYPIDESVSSVTAIKAARNDANIEAMRDDVGADLVILYRPYIAGEPCGIAYRPTSFYTQNWVSYSLVSIDCASYVTAHEVGHNMGLGHSHAQGSSGLYSYALGHGVHSKFVTLMAYASAYQAKKLYKMSSPELDCEGLPCGIALGQANEADAVTASNQTAPLVESLRDTKASCDTHEQEIVDSVKAEYEQQQVEMNQANVELAEYEEVLTEKLVVVNDAGTTYRGHRDEHYYPAYQAYASLLSEVRNALDQYYAGTMALNELIDVYQEYQRSRESLISESTVLRSIYLLEYLPAIKGYKSAKSSLDDYQNNEYKLIAEEMDRIEAEYNEVISIYHCS